MPVVSSNDGVPEIADGMQASDDARTLPQPRSSSTILAHAGIVATLLVALQVEWFARDVLLLGFASVL